MLPGWVMRRCTVREQPKDYNGKYCQQYYRKKVKKWGKTEFQAVLSE